MSTDVTERPLENIVIRLRAFPQFWLNGAAWMRGCEPEPLCIEAADEIERLRKALSEIARYGHEWHGTGTKCAEMAQRALDV